MNSDEANVKKEQEREVESSKLEKELKKVRGQLALAKKQNNQQLKNVEAKVKEQQKELDEKQKELLDMKEQLDKKTASSEETTTTRNMPAGRTGDRKLEQQLTEVNRQLHLKERKAEELRKQITGLEVVERDYTQLKENYEKKDMQAKELEQQIERLKKEANEDLADKVAPSESDTKIKELRTQIRQLEDENKLLKTETPEMGELKKQMERQSDAFHTIRSELSIQRKRQFDSESKLEREKNGVQREKKELEINVQRLRKEYEEHLEKIWEEYESMKNHHEENLSLGRSALDAAQVKLMMNGQSPVSENGFDWNNSDNEDEDEEDEEEEHDKKHIPSVGKLPPLEKPAFFEFMEAPRCSSCQSEIFDI
jgi:chromosome segregation ATPase